MTATTDPDVAEVVVLGGGIGGLAAALELTRAGVRPVVLEAGAAPGGAVAAHTVGGLLLDAGAESFATARPATAALIDDLGLTDRVSSPAPAGAWVRHAGGTAPLPATAFLGIPGHPWAADVRRVIGLPGAVRAGVDRLLPARTGAGGSLGAMVRTRMGTRVLERLVEPVAGGVYAAHPDGLDVGTVAPGLPTALTESGSLAAAARRLRGAGGRPGSAVASLTGGLHTLLPALLAALTAAGGDVRSGVRATGLTRSGTDGGWLVEVPGGQLAARRVVLALPAQQARALLAAALPALQADVLGEPVSPVALVTLALADARLDAAPRGTGVLVAARAGGPRAKALTHATVKWPWLARAAGPGRHVLRLSYGRGAGSASIPADPDLPGIALADAADLLGVPLRPASVLDSAVVRWDSALPVPRPGHAAAVQTLRAALAGHGLFVVGSAVAGTGLGAVIGDARQQAQGLADVAGSTPAGAPTRRVGERGWTP